MLERDADHAAVLLQKLIAERPIDLAMSRLAERLPLMQKSGSVQVPPKVTPGAHGQG